MLIEFGECKGAQNWGKGNLHRFSQEAACGPLLSYGDTDTVGLDQHPHKFKVTGFFQLLFLSSAKHKVTIYSSSILFYFWRGF